MGVVYEAEDLKLGRRVALKLISAKSEADPIAIERFWREARTASALNHPGICTIHDMNDSESQPFLVMELLEGQTLDRTYGGHAVPLPRLLELGVQLADALDAAHRRGILHRDMKPSNIFVTGSGQTKILDFGLARLEAAGEADSTDAGRMLTSPGSTLGTIAYMSPEQARGETLDARSDIFSLGVVLYEMATGRHPFEGTTSAVVFDKLLNYVPVAPISLNHELPPAFENILSKALEKDREMRYQSAADLRADLRRLQRGSSASRIAAVPAAPPTARSYPGMTRADSAAKVTTATAASQSAAAPRSPASRRLPLAQLVRLAGLAAAIIVLAFGVIRHIRRTHAVDAVVAPAPVPAKPIAPAPVAVAPPATPVAKPSAAIARAPAAPRSVARHTSIAGTPGRAAQPSVVQPVAAPAPAIRPAAVPVAPSAPKPAPAPVPAYATRHVRFFGRSTTGTLRLSATAFVYTASGDSVSLRRADIRAIEGNTVVGTNGKRWRFEISGMTNDQVHALLAGWLAHGATPGH